MRLFTRQPTVHMDNIPAGNRNTETCNDNCAFVCNRYVLPTLQLASIFKLGKEYELFMQLFSQMFCGFINKACVSCFYNWISFVIANNQYCKCKQFR